MGSTGPPLLLSSGRSFGGKCSEYVLHFGSLINQQLFPAVEHMHKRAEEGGSQDEFYVLAPSYLESTVAFHFLIRDVFLREISKNSPAHGIEGGGFSVIARTTLELADVVSEKRRNKWFCGTNRMIAR